MQNVYWNQLYIYVYIEKEVTEIIFIIYLDILYTYNIYIYNVKFFRIHKVINELFDSKEESISNPRLLKPFLYKYIIIYISIYLR